MRTLLRVFFATLLAAGFIASGGTGAAGQTASSDTNPTPPKLRLPSGPRPTGYRVALDIDPGKTTFRGAVDIAVSLPEATSLLWLNGTDLQIEKVTAAAGKSTPAVRVVPGGEDFVGFAFERAVGPGDLTLHVEYTGKLDETSTQGLFRQKSGEDWYAFSQLETSDARRAFPCFDEPAFKTPWELTLTIPKGTTAVSNMSIESEKAGSNGSRVIRFKKTPPLPSYLVALGVGPFDYVDGGRAGRNKTPIRIITPRGKASQARFAISTTKPLLELLEAYFGMPFPFEKLDQLAIPQTVTFGAMENAGLITWGEQYLLAPPSEETPTFRRTQASYNAHEIAHQWFGDLVTLDWWDDVWLNESFATWIGERTVQEWKPEWSVDVTRVVDRSDVMTLDTLVSSRKIRQEIETVDDIANAFDPISYQKGGAVITMFENWIGTEKFRNGVRRYLDAHRYGTATSNDFLSAIQAASFPGVAAAFSSFLDQAGVPLIGASLDCSGEKPRLALSQTRMLPAGTHGSSAVTWHVPVCVRGGKDGGKDGSDCSLLSEPSGTMPAPSASCPEWLLANDGEVGYYRVLYGGDLLDKLLDVSETELTVAERVGVLRDVAALAGAGLMPMGDALALVPRFANDPSRPTVEAALAIVEAAGDPVIPEELRPAYGRFLTKTFGERARGLGFKSRPGDTEETKMLRETLVPLVAMQGGDPALVAEARRLALAWLADQSAVEAQMAAEVLQTAARHGDRALFEKYKNALKTIKERRDRVRLLTAMGAFTDPAILQDAFVLSEQYDTRETFGLFFLASQTPAGREARWAYAKSNYDAILARLPREVTGAMPTAGAKFCDPEHRQDVEEFFRGRVEKLPGGQRNLAQVLENMDLCIALRGKQEGSLKEELARY